MKQKIKNLIIAILSRLIYMAFAVRLKIEKVAISIAGSSIYLSVLIAPYVYAIKRRWQDWRDELQNKPNRFS